MMLAQLHQQITIPLSSLLPPSSTHAGPSRPLLSPAYILGPLPSTSPLHLALGFLSSSDPSSRDPGGIYPVTPASKGKQKEDNAPAAKESDAARRGAPARVLVIAGGKGEFQDRIAEEDEAWFRNHGGHYEVVRKLKRVDMRYCPTPAHLQALLTVISADNARQPSNMEGHNVEKVPGMVVLWDAAGLFMCEDEGDENVPPAGEGEVDMEGGATNEGKREKMFKPGTCISDYLNVIAAARATADHLSSLHPSEPPVHLVVLEPSIHPSAFLPIQPAAVPGDPAGGPAKTREKMIPLIDGARRMLGRDAVGVIEPDAHPLEGNDDEVARYSLAFEAGGERFGLSQKVCGGGDWNQGSGMISGYQWEWV
ncbi:hypothetical protein IAT38_004280 [Cryptococcus sp. DSM 104549]